MHLGNNYKLLDFNDYESCAIGLDSIKLSLASRKMTFSNVASLIAKQKKKTKEPLLSNNHVKPIKLVGSNNWS